MHSVRPIESHSGARENIIAGPYHPPHSVGLEIETLKVLRGRKRGERCPLTIRLGVRGSVVSSPSRVRGRAPAENDFMHILGQKEAIWNTIFSRPIFERRRAPKRREARENFPPFPPSRRACTV